MSTRSKTSLARILYYIVPNTITGFAYGWEVASMGGILAMPAFLEYMHTPSDFTQGIMTAALIAGEFFGTLFIGLFCSDRLGRRFTIILSCAIYLVGQAILVASQNRGMFIAGRVINGLGAGPLFQTMAFYTAEISPTEIRGRLVATLNAGIALGILVAYWVQYGFLSIPGNAAWRSCFALQLIPGVIVAIVIWFRPESPRWLVQHDKQEMALKVLADLHADGDTTSNLVRAELEEIRVVVSLEQSPDAPSYINLLFGRDYRRRSALAMGLQCMQQLSGANIVLYYAGKVFAQTGRTGAQAALLANGISSALLFGATTSLTIMIDYYGRRRPIFIGHGTMGTCLVIVGSILIGFGAPHFDHTTQAVQFTFQDKDAGNAAVAFMFLFQVAFGAFSSSVPWTFQNEVFPVIARARGTALSVATNFFTNFWLGLYIPKALNTASWRVYFIFGALNFTSMVLGYLFYPETTGKSLEELDLLFTPERSAWVFRDRDACSKRPILSHSLSDDPEIVAHELRKRLVLEKGGDAQMAEDLGQSFEVKSAHREVAHNEFEVEK
ncbi:high affinity glucose transporter [Cladophialophora chaetospira]|uniref:High affinity glucose transporter n=1 Tax=Cladophialophora chaetospira TaxID=386627 RepID=A0AA38TXN7_9EURO|nr:high affinity glucose transporter [Cladophialophora chaetospira]